MFFPGRMKTKLCQTINAIQMQLFSNILKPIPLVANKQYIIFSMQSQCVLLELNLKESFKVKFANSRKCDCVFQQINDLWVAHLPVYLVTIRINSAKKKAAPKTRPRKARACTHKGLQIQALSTALAQNALVYDCTIPAQVASGSLETISNKSALLLHKQSNVRWDWA